MNIPPPTRKPVRVPQDTPPALGPAPLGVHVCFNSTRVRIRFQSSQPNFANPLDLSNRTFYGNRTSAGSQTHTQQLPPVWGRSTTTNSRAFKTNAGIYESISQYNTRGQQPFLYSSPKGSTDEARRSPGPKGIHDPHKLGRPTRARLSRRQRSRRVHPARIQHHVARTARPPAAAAGHASPIPPRFRGALEQTPWLAERLMGRQSSRTDAPHGFLPRGPWTRFGPQHLCCFRHENSTARTPLLTDKTRESPCPIGADGRLW